MTDLNDNTHWQECTFQVPCGHCLACRFEFAAWCESTFPNAHLGETLGWVKDWNPGSHVVRKILRQKHLEQQLIEEGYPSVNS